MENEDRRKVRLMVNEAAELMGVSPQFIRTGLQQNALPFGSAVKHEKRWTYYIFTKQFTEVTGIDVN